MKYKLLNAALIATSVLAYLEWSGDSSMFLLSAEAEIIAKLFTDPASVIHPFTLLPLAGQLILLATLFQKRPGRGLTYVGLGCIALLLYFIFIIGIMAMNIKIFGSTLPFVTISVLTIIAYQRRRKIAIVQA